MYCTDRHPVFLLLPVHCLHGNIRRKSAAALSTQILQLFPFHRQTMRIDCMDRVPEYSVAGYSNLFGNDTLSDSDSRYFSPFPVTCLHKQSRWCGLTRRISEIILICHSYGFLRQEYTARIGNRCFSCLQSAVCPEASGGSRRPALSRHMLHSCSFTDKR